MNRTVAWTLGVLALVVLAVVLFLLLAGRQPVAEASPSPSASPTAEPTPSFNEALLTQRLTVLLVGLDLNEVRREENEAQNADALMLLSISADQSQVVLVSLPRDTVDLPLPDGNVYDEKINALYAEQGMETLVGAMEELYGVPIDGHVLLDMDDFTSLVEAVDGVTANPPEPLRDPQINLDLQPGEQELDPQTALSYVRSRVDQDYGRMGRQQEVLVDLARRLVDAEREIDLRALADGLESLETDLSLDDLPTYAEIARRAQAATVTNLVISSQTDPPLITFEGDRGDGRGYILEPDVDGIRTEVTALIPPEE
jgi:LCP family protein required for cell wall assembly